MNIRTVATALPFALLVALPVTASAHEHGTFQIGKNYYQIVVGSLNEPVAVDDKTGVDFSVTKCFTSTCAPTRSTDGDLDGPSGTPVTGLESTLKVELAAGDQKKELSFTPVYGKAGSYAAPFYPTVATTYAYRINGTINDVPVDVTFSCLPESAAAPANDTTPKQLSDGFTQLTRAGKFGCPKPKEDLGFPEPAPALAALQSDASQGSTRSNGAIGLGAAALALAVASFVKRR